MSWTPARRHCIRVHLADVRRILDGELRCVVAWHKPEQERQAPEYCAGDYVELWAGPTPDCGGPSRVVARVTHAFTWGVPAGVPAFTCLSVEPLPPAQWKKEINHPAVKLATRIGFAVGLGFGLFVCYVALAASQWLQ